MMLPPPSPAAEALPPAGARQLALPLEHNAGPPASPLAPVDWPIPPRQVWAGLPPTARQALRRAVLRVLQEASHAADRA
jgi:hypothetical protein